MKTNHIVAIFGGAVAGSEAAHVLTQHGISVVVFEQNVLPYGKIETGLPKWHVKLRDRQEEKIDQKLDNPLVHYVPCCCLGKDVIFDDVCRNWGFSAVLLATGAWQDRSLPVDGIDIFVNKGLYYQNPFVQWFNQNHDPGYVGETFEIKDGTVVVGGGLASIDVLKILMIETFCDAVRKRGLDIDTLTVERLGLPQAADKLGISLKDLKLKGATLYYRRRIIDMPISPAAANLTDEGWEKVYNVRRKIVRLAQEKYCFEMRECYTPVKYVADGDTLKSIVFQKTKIENGRVIPIENEFHTASAETFISSIGSVPQKLPGVPYRGEKFNLADEESGRFEGYDNVFALGNAVTGKGNIKESQRHARDVTHLLVERYFEQQAQKGVDGNIVQWLSARPFPLDEQFRSILNKIKRLQQKAGFDGNYEAWVAKHRPARLEKMLEIT